MTEQESRPTPDEIVSVLSQLRGGIDGFRDHWDYYRGVSEFRIDCLFEDAVKVIEHLQQSQAKSLTPDQVERAMVLVTKHDHNVYGPNTWRDAIELLREVVGDVL